METINTETLVTSLFRVGFDKVDSILFSYTLGSIKSNEEGRKNFYFDDKMLSSWFTTYVEFKDGLFSLKEGYSLDSMVETPSNANVPLYHLLLTNRKLTDYLKTLDFTEIISKKVLVLGENSIEESPSLFSEKEKEIINGKTKKLVCKQKNNILQ